MNDEEILLLSEDMNRLINSNLGKFMIARINSVLEHTQASLINIDPSDATGIMALQERYKLYQSFFEMIEELNVAGNYAFDVINQKYEDM